MITLLVLLRVFTSFRISVPSMSGSLRSVTITSKVLGLEKLHGLLPAIGNLDVEPFLGKDGLDDLPLILIVLYYKNRTFIMFHVHGTVIVIVVPSPTVLSMVMVPLWGIDKPFGNGQAQAHAESLGGIVGLENLFHLAPVYAFPAVFHGEVRRVILP